MTYLEFNQKQKQINAELDSLFSQSRWADYNAKLFDYASLLVSYCDHSEEVNNDKQK